MKLLITGGAGYIGSHTAHSLIRAGHEVIVFDNLSTGYRNSLAQQIELIVGDIRNADLLTRVLKNHEIEGVLHFAAKLIVPESILVPLDYYDTNVFGTIQLLKACRDANVSKFVFSSTAAVYGQGDARPMSEIDATLPINPYGRSKLFAESIINDYQQSSHGFRSIILRYFNVAGAALDGSNGQFSENATHLVSVACKVLAKKRARIEIFGDDYATTDGTCVRDFIHIEDLASAHVAAIQALAQNHTGGVFNCGYGRGASVREVIDMLSKISGKEVPSTCVARRLGDPAYLVANPTRLRSELGWEPQIDSLEHICRSALEWELTRSTF